MISMINKNKLLIIIIVVVILVLAFGIWFFIFRGKNIVGPQKNQNNGLIVTSTEPLGPQVFIKLPEGAPDADSDGISDEQEKKQGLSTTEFDTDHDGLSDSTELRIKTDPKNPDTDGDGYSDGIEVVTGHDPLKK